MPTPDVFSHLQAENRTVPAQTKLKRSEHDDLVEFVKFCRSRGLDVTVSSALRAFVLSGLAAFKENQGRSSH